MYIILAEIMDYAVSGIYSCYVLLGAVSNEPLNLRLIFRKVPMYFCFWPYVYSYYLLYIYYCS